MSVAESINVRELVRKTSPVGPADLEIYEELLISSQLTDFRQEIQAILREVGGDDTKLSEETLARAGIGAYMLGNHRMANECLSEVTGDPIASYYHGLVFMGMDRPAEAQKKFQEAAKNGYDKVECILKEVGTLRKLGELEKAEELMKSASREGASRAEYSFQWGCIWADRGDTDRAVEYFDRAVKMDPHHSQALFWLAGENNLHGNDEEAIRLYEQALSKPPLHIGAMLNLGLLYEDAENYPAAAYCFNRVLEVDPNHARAELYLKDIDATKDMFYDEETARQEARLEQLLKRPITDFELSVRSRNCLQSVGIYTLGDLTTVSDNELLAAKNFGETSLHEIRDLMQQHNLRIGQNLHQAKSQEALLYQKNLSAEEQAQLSKPVSDLNLSVRARKCMVRLGISTIGELLQRTADELLGSRNFGVTSLNEIRAKLKDNDLKLRND